MERALDSRLVDAAVTRVLVSDELWLVVDEIANSPAVTMAISRQERASPTRWRPRWACGRAARTPGSSGSPADAAPPTPCGRCAAAARRRGTAVSVAARYLFGVQSAGPGPWWSRRSPPRVVVEAAPTAYVGLVTRAIAFALDAAVINAVAILMAAVVALSFSIVSIPDPLQSVAIAAGGVLYILWLVGYFVTFWATTGQDPGSRALRLRVRTVEASACVRGGAAALAALTLAALPLFAGLDDPRGRSPPGPARPPRAHGRRRGSPRRAGAASQRPAAATMSAPARLRIYRFGSDSAFEGGVAGAERLGGRADAELLDALFAAHAAAGELQAVDLATARRRHPGGAARLPPRPGRRRDMTRSTLAIAAVPSAVLTAIVNSLEPGDRCSSCSPVRAALADTLTRAGGALVADHAVAAETLADVAPRLSAEL